MSELKEMATLLTKVATQRQIAIKGLVADAMELMKDNYSHKLPAIND